MQCCWEFLDPSTPQDESTMHPAAQHHIPQNLNPKKTALETSNLVILTFFTRCVPRKILKTKMKRTLKNGQQFDMREALFQHDRHRQYR